MGNEEAIALPGGWVNVRLEDLVLNPKSDLVDGPFGSNLKSSEYVDSGVPVLKIQNIKANRFVRKRLSYVTPEKAAQLDRHSFVAGDLMITKLGEPLGLCCKVPDDLAYGVFVADLMRLRPSPKIVDSAFLLHAINSVVVQNQFKEITKGTTRQRVNLTIVRDIKISLPPLAEQHRIVAKIEELFSELEQGVASLKTAREQLKVYRQSLLKNAFEGKLTAAWRAAHADQIETAAALQQRIARERQARYQQQLADWQTAGQPGPKPKPPKSLPPLTAEELAELPKLPERWGWVRLETIQAFEKHAVKAGPFGSALKKEFYVSDGFKIYGQEQVIRGDHTYGDYFISEAKYADLSSCAVRPFDVLISLVGTIGKVLVLPERAAPGIINPRLVKISLNRGAYLPAFFKAYFESGFLRSLYATESQGTTMDILNLGMIQGLPYPLCSLEEQQEILSELESKLSEADQLDQTLATALQQADALRQSILKKAFCGQLVKQDKNDEPATALLERIRAAKLESGKGRRRRIAPQQPEVLELRASPGQVIPFPASLPGIAAKDLHAGILAMAYRLHEQHPERLQHFGHVKAEKICHLVEAHLGLDLERQPLKEAAGPNDYPQLKRVEHRARMVKWFDVTRLDSGKYVFHPKSGFERLLTKVHQALGQRLGEVERLLELMLPMTMRQAEILATVYAAWNNLLLLGKLPNDEEIVTEARENWHESKLKIEREKFFRALEWMREKGLVPVGRGRFVASKDKA